MRSWGLLASAALLACHRPEATAPPDATRPTPPEVTAEAATPAPTAKATASALRGVVITSLGAGRSEITTTESVSLSPRARLERRAEGGAFAEVTDLDAGAGYRLRASCTSPASDAPVALAVGETLRPVPWSGLSCSAQCNLTCRANAFLGPGTFRLVVRGEAGGELAGPTFEMPGPEHAEAPALERWGLAQGVTRATAARVDLARGVWEPGAPARADQIAGLVPRREPRAVEGDLTNQLVERLRDAKGFDDRVLKRCLMGSMVGFRMTRSLPTTGAPREETVDVAFDLTCAKLFVVHGAGAARSVHATHFDPSRAALLALAKRALPDDAELAARK